MTIVMPEHPAWTLNDGVWLRAFSSVPESVAVVMGSRWRVVGPTAYQPELVELTSVPATVPLSLRSSLASLGSVARWRTPDLWEAVATAIIRQVIRADQARILHHRFRAAHGQPVPSPHGVLHLMPDAGTVANLPTEAFTSLGMAFKRRPLQAAAAACIEQGAKWAGLPPAQLVEELQTVPRIGPWTAGAAVADFTHDWSLYPHGDLAVRKWAALAAPDIDWPEKEDAFAAQWRRIAGDQLGPLTLFTLAWGVRHGGSP
jgi:DNA-3-methyladenine glycosylase II